MAPRSLTFLALLAALFSPQHPAAEPARPAPLQKGPPAIAGAYDSPFGRILVEVTGASVSGKLLVPTQGCPFAASEEELFAALLGEKALSLRFLKIASLNGHGSAEGIDRDPDPSALRDEPAHRALAKANL